MTIERNEFGECKICERGGIKVALFANGKCIICQSISSIENRVEKLEE